MRTADQVIEDALREEVRELLSQCTQPERAGFCRHFPEGVDRLTVQQLRDVIALIHRTILWRKPAIAGGE